jgi:plastocyanin
MNRSTRLVPAALLLVGTLAACAPAADEGTASAAQPSIEPMASHDMGSAPMPSASASATTMVEPTASHDMAGMNGGGRAVTVDIANFAFVQDEIEVSVGDTVEWVNGDGTRHTVTSGADDEADGMFDSGDVEAGESFSFTFTEPGEFAYFCDIHPTMTGVVVVTP